MRNMTDILNAARVARLLYGHAGADDRHMAVEVVASTGSTNADLRERIPRLDGPLLLAAERQTAGRGRAGRSWLAEPGDSLCFSLAWRFDHPQPQLVGLSLAIGVALADALNGVLHDAPPDARAVAPADSLVGWPRSAGVAVQLKWPNDLLLDGAKLGGILIETAADAQRDRTWAVIGVGLNVRAHPARDAAAGQPVASLFSTMSNDMVVDIDHDRLLAQLAASLRDACSRFEQDGLSAFIARWNALHAHAQQEVMLIEQGRELHRGMALGIDASGRLLLDTGTGIVRISAGDISLRAAASNSADSEPVHAAD